MAFACRILLMLASAMAVATAVVAGLTYPPIGIGLLAVMAWRHFPKRWQAWSHGTARLADMIDLWRHRMLSDRDGLILGTTAYAGAPSRLWAVLALFNPFIGSANACRLFAAAFLGRKRGIVRIVTYIHLATFAPTGKGKGVSILIPNLLSYRGSCVITDPKGELYTLTSDHRRKMFKNRVVRLDPFGVCGPGGDSINPLDFIDDTASDFPEQCRDLAAAFVIRTGKEQDTHWCDSAEIVLTCFIAWVCACHQDRSRRNLSTVRKLLSGRAAYMDAIVEMKKVQSHGGVIAQMGRLLEWYVDRELGSVLSTVQRFTSFLDSEAMQDVTRDSSFSPLDLRSGRVTVHLVLPPERLSTIPAIMRMWITVILRTLTKSGADERNPVLFLLDECAHIGHIQALEDAVTLMRGYGIRLWMFFQSADQMKKCFGERAPTVLDNIGVQQYFGTTAYESAEAISKRVGDLTMFIESVNDTISRSTPRGGDGRQGGSDSESTSTTRQAHGRAIFRPDEVLRLPSDLALVFADNLPVIPVRLLKYFDSPLFQNGGTGVSRGFGFAGALAAVLAMLFSLGCLLVIAAVLLSPRPATTSSPGFQDSPIDELVTAHRRARVPARRRQPYYSPTPPSPAWRYYDPLWDVW